MISKTIVCDVLVVGSGVSGVCAAVSASRKGTEVVLVEKNDFPGGTAIIAMHRYICGLHLKGVGLEVSHALNKLEPENKIIFMGKLKVLPFQTKHLEIVLRNLIKAQKKLKVFYNTTLFSLKKEKGLIISVRARRAGMILNIQPKVVIDASGEGVVIKLSRADYQLTPLRERQMQGFSVRLKGIEVKDQLLSIKVPYSLRKAAESKEILKCFRFTTFVFGSAKGEGFCKFNIPYIRGFSINKNAAIVHNYLRKALPEFKNSYIAEISSCIVEREGMRLVGEYILTRKDILASRKFYDAVVRGDWPIEFWHQKNGQQVEYLKPGRFYEIPLRVLRSKNIKNLFATGRCISATSEAIASSRVMGICIALGEAAGTAASKYARTIS